ncbi:MAG: response regulator [Phenylobacterium sp.]|uniref:hybrid sensor histidine kinase/response regulator n=1 Tax=Phenylobacterium sp. TaxID=1871053 RepID=UPI0025FDF658|nr:PAS domain-containing hybrid sensor histidine kinase/response regulator [Phenylobacterium sp.]MBI1197151.1 response regulator [Phenylobacterium sp.]
MSTQRQSLTLDDLPIAMARLDGRHVILEANTAFRALAGAGGEPVGARFAHVLEAAGAVAQDGEFGRVFRIRVDDADRVFRLTLHVHGEDNLAILSDVTAAREAAERHRPAADVRDQLMHDAEIGVWRYDPDIDTYYFPAELSLGHGEIGRPLPRETLQLLQHRDDRASNEEIRERITREGGTAQSEVRYLTATGEWTHLHVHYRAGKQLPSGRYEMHGVSQNVTSLAKARDEARANARRLGLALAASGAGVFEVDFKTGRLWLSPEAEALAGGVAIDFDDPVSVFHPDDHAMVSALADRPAGHSADPVDARLLTADGYRWVRVCFEVEHKPDGTRRRGVGLVVDVDEAKRQEIALREARRLAEEATVAKSDFLASVSHEIRTPMNGVVGVLNLLKRERLTADGAQLLDEALGCAEMLGQLINDVLDFSKIEAGKLALAPAPTDPAAILDGVTHLLAPQAEAKGLTLRTEVAADIGWVEVDPVRLRQCLFNIIGNAVKFTETGGVVVRAWAAGKGPARRLRFEVEDTGIGVSEAARERLFQRFEQAEAGTTRRFGGTGLGLAISRQLVRMMGGDLDLESREGEGSTFWFEVAAPAAAAPSTEPAATADIDDAPLAGLKVLIVDDNRVNRLVGVRSVEALGAGAEAVESGPEAIEAVSTGGYDLVLMDVNMPGMDGLEATRRIRGLPAPAGETPILALTADVMRQQRQAYVAAGMNGMTPKPFSPAQLLAEIARIAGAEAA